MITPSTNIEHLKQIDNLKGELNSNMTEPRLFLIIEHLTDIVTIQERNISALEKRLSEKADRIHGHTGLSRPE